MLGFARLIAHATFPAPVVFTSEGLFFAGLGAAVAARGGIFRGDPATVPVSLSLSDATIVPITTIHVVPNQGHIHLYLDGSVVAMTGLQTSLSVSPGTHTLRAEFVASDHGSFHPPVTAEVTFEAQPR